MRAAVTGAAAAVSLAAAREIKALVEEAAAAAQSLRDQARDLSVAVGAFRTAGVLGASTLALPRR